MGRSKAGKKSKGNQCKSTKTTKKEQKKEKAAGGFKEAPALKIRQEKRRCKEVDGRQLLLDRGGSTNLNLMKSRMKQKVLDRLIARNPPKPELMNAYRDLARLHAEAQRNQKALDCYDKLLALDPTDPLKCSLHYTTLLMDDTRSDEARSVLEKNESLMKTATGLYTMALLEYISSVILEEEGSDFDHATDCLKKAVEVNPFVAEFIAFNDTFCEVFDPGMVDELIGWDPAHPSKPIDVALQYCATYGQVSVWLDAEGADFWIRNTIFRDDEYVKENNPLQDTAGKGHLKLLPFWKDARNEAMEKMTAEDELSDDEEMSDADSDECPDLEQGSDDEMSDEVEAASEVSDEDVEASIQKEKDDAAVESNDDSFDENATDSDEEFESEEE